MNALQVKSITLEELIDEEFGKTGKKREQFEANYKYFELSYLLQQARLEKGLTQVELAKCCGTNAADISRIENDIKEVQVSTLQKVVEEGFGGCLDISIRL